MFLFSILVFNFQLTTHYTITITILYKVNLYGIVTLKIHVKLRCFYIKLCKEYNGKMLICVYTILSIFKRIYIPLR